MKRKDKETIEFIKEHKDDRPRTLLAKRAGVSLNYLYKKLHEFGCDFENNNSISEYQIERNALVTKLYKDHSSREIAKIIGCTHATIDKIVARLGLKHSEETSKRLREKSLKNLRKSKSKENIEKRIKTRKRTIRMERFRILSGMPQKTKMKLKKIPLKIYHAKWNLITKYNYFAFENEPFLVGYDKNTKRINEEYYINKYGLTFINDELCQED